MRSFIVAVLLAVSIGFVGASGASAAPINGTANATMIQGLNNADQAACWRTCNRWGRCWTRCNGAGVYVAPLVSGCAFGSHRVCNGWGRCWRVCN